MAEWTLHVGDCLDPVTGLASLEDGSIDHVVCDPPFASEIYSRVNLTNHQTTRTGTSPGLIVMKAGGIGSLDSVLVGSVNELARVARRWVLMFCDVESLGSVRELMVGAGMRYVRAGAWVKVDPMPQFSGDRPAQGFEVVAIAHAGSRGRMRWNGGGKPGLWRFAICKEDRPEHPCPKPLDLMMALLRDFTDPGDLVCDPFAGSGTTGVAAIRLGRRFVGWERDARYAEVARKRLERAREQLELCA